MDTLIKGKALLVIQRHATGFDVETFIQSCSGGWEAHESVKEAIWCAEVGRLPLPVAADRICVGEVLRVAVTYRLSYSQDYFGEWDTDLEYYKARVLRRQTPRRCYP